MPAVELFLLGVLAALCLVAGLCFLKFWRKTKDPLFLAFGASFLIRSVNDATRASMERPNEATTWSYMIGIVSSLLILVAILYKNFGENGKR